MMKDGMKPKLVEVGRVLVDKAKSGTNFRPPAGPSKSDARSTLWTR